MASPGNYFNLRYLGCTPVKHSQGLGHLQTPLHNLYVSYLAPKGPRQLIICRLAVTDRGIIITTNGNDTFCSMRDILMWEAVQWVFVQTKDKKIMSAFEPLIPDHHRGSEGLFSKLDSQYKYLAKLKHEPFVAIVLQKTSGSKPIEVHGFMCASEEQVTEVVDSLWQAEQLFQHQESRPVGVVKSPQGIPNSERRSSASQNRSEFMDSKASRQARRRQVDGEITLEELIRLADRALADPEDNAAAAEPGFKMGESWTAKEQNGIQRSRTFNEGGPRQREPVLEEGFAQQGRRESQLNLVPVGNVEPPRGLNNSGNQSQGAPYYANVKGQKPEQPRTYENMSINSTPPNSLEHPPGQSPLLQHHQLQELDKKRKSVQPDSLRMVIAESKLSAANKRTSVLPGMEFSSAMDLSGAQRHAVADVYAEQIVVPPSSKPVALVQPRKVPRYKVLPENATEIQLNKVPSHQSGNGGQDDPKKEQYQMGIGGNGRNYTRSMYELNNIVTKPTTPQALRKGMNQDSDPSRKASNIPEGSDISRKFSNPEPDAARKASLPEAVNQDGKDNKSGDKQKGKKDAEMEAFAMNVNFDRLPASTLSPHGTNFESALGYFP